MNKIKRISQVFNSAEIIPFDDSSKIILMSDVHRGDGSWADDFLKNQNLYFAALNHYYYHDYTYIEIGDGDELWKNQEFSDIVYVHNHIFRLLSKYFKEGRLYFIFGNHDMIKKDAKYAKKNLSQYFDEQEKRYMALFENAKFHEGLVLRHRVTYQKIFLIHGHQVNFIDYQAWKLGRFLVRYLWRPLELIGVHDPTSTAKNHTKKDAVEKNLTEWVLQEKQLLIAGHTHRPMFPNVGNPQYFNDGSSVHPHGISGIEITNGEIALVEWKVKTRIDGTMFIGRDILAGPTKLTDYIHIKAV